MPSSERLMMYTMLSAQIMNNLAIRFGLPAMIYFMQLEYKWSATQVARVLGAFFPGYIATQVPSGWFAQKFGGKGILTVNMLGNAILLCFVPAAAGMGRGYLQACFCAMGLFQGPLIPAQGAIKAEWLKGLGGERAFALRIMGLGSKLAATVTGAAVPFIATRAGWRAVAYTYGACTAAMALIWQLLATNAPRAAVPPVPDVTDREGRPVSPPNPARSQRCKAKKVAEWGVLRVRAAQATVWGHIADNFMTYMMNQMGPIVFTEVCGVSTGAMGGFLAIPPTVNCIGSFLIAGVEAMLLKRGLSQLHIQKLMTTLGSIVEATSLVWFGRCRSAINATLAWCGVVVGHLLHGDHRCTVTDCVSVSDQALNQKLGFTIRFCRILLIRESLLISSLLYHGAGSGFFTNYEDVGGPDSAILWAVGNPLASLPGYFSPIIAAVIKSSTGQYNGLFNLAAALQISVAVFFCLCGSTTPARDLLAQKRAAKRQRRQLEAELNNLFIREADGVGRRKQTRVR